MLKIKDNVDLKELEKFGFLYDCMYSRWFTNYNKAFEYIYINSFNRNIAMDSLNGMASSLLFDLIQEGLVEKVGGESE